MTILRMPENPQNKADRHNDDDVIAMDGSLLERYWVVRNNSLLEIPRMELILAERRHILAWLDEWLRRHEHKAQQK